MKGITLVFIIFMAGILGGGMKHIKNAFNQHGDPVVQTAKAGAEAVPNLGINHSTESITIITASRYNGDGRSKPIDIREDGECVIASAPVIIALNFDKYPASARHMSLAWKAGAPRIWHVDRENAGQNRADALAGTSNSKLKRHVVPLVSTSESGKGAGVAYIPRADKRHSNSYINNALTTYCDGQAYRIRIER